MYYSSNVVLKLFFVFVMENKFIVAQFCGKIHLLLGVMQHEQQKEVD